MADKRVLNNIGPSDPDLKRSTFDRSYTNNLTCNIGKVYPCMVDMAMPNSTYNINCHFAFDMFPMLSPIQSTIRCHVKYYKIPLRILWDSYEDMFSRVHIMNADQQMQAHEFPYINRTENWHLPKSLAEYMGIPSQLFRNEVQETSLQFFLQGWRHFNNGLLMDGLEYLFGSSERPETDYYMSPFSPNASSFASTSPERQYHFSNVLNKPLSDGLFSFAFWQPASATKPDIGNYSFRFGAFVPKVQSNAYSETFEVITNLLDYSITHQSPDQSPTNLTPGRWCFSTLSAGVTVNCNGVSYKRWTVILKLTGDAVSAINSLISEYKSVRLFYGVSSYAVNMWFGQSRDTAFSVPLDSFQLEGGTKPSQSSEADPYRVTHSPYVPQLIGLESNPTFNVLSVINDTEQHSPFVSYDGAAPKIPINAFAFRAYEFIHNFFYRKSRIDPFWKDGLRTYNKFLTNTNDGADSTTPVDFFNCLYEDDIFTDALLTPQMGPAPLVGITTNDDDSSTATLNMVDTESGEHYHIGVLLDPDNNITGIANYDEVADKTSVMRLTEAINFGISINDFRNVSAMQLLEERYQKAGYLYPDLVQEFFGVRPPVGEEYPEFLGGITRAISIDPVTNVAQSKGNALGEKGGKAFVSGHSEQISCFCKEWCIIMGVVYFSVTPIYTQKIDKHFLYNHYLDFYNPQLANIGPQPIFKKQITPLQLSDEHLDDVFGYSRAWVEFTSRQDEAHGDFRDSLYHYLLMRSFVEAPSLGHNFVTMDMKDLNDVWAVLNSDVSDKFYGAIRHEMYVTMPLPKVSIPKIVG